LQPKLETAGVEWEGYDGSGLNLRGERVKEMVVKQWGREGTIRITGFGFKAFRGLTPTTGVAKKRKV